MPLKGYLKASDHTRISTISVDGRWERRKRLDLTRHATASGRSSMYVRDCVEHDSPETIGGLVPVELFENIGVKRWMSRGIFKCCVLCWRIIDPTFPVVTEQPLDAVYPSDKLKAKRRASRTPRKRVPKEERISLADRVWNFLEGRPNQWFTVYEIMAAVQASRAGVVNELKPLIKAEHVIVERGGHGMGDTTKYCRYEEGA